MFIVKGMMVFVCVIDVILKWVNEIKGGKVFV